MESNILTSGEIKWKKNILIHGGRVHRVAESANARYLKFV